MILAPLAFVLAGAAPAQAPAAKAAPMSVAVDVAATSGAGAHAWEKELRTALEARKDEFRLVKPGDKAELVVRVVALTKGQGESSVMKGVLVLGSQEKAFNLTYGGEIHVQAEKLARNLHNLAEQLKPATPAPKK
jgi:hypothetical protein